MVRHAAVGRSLLHIPHKLLEVNADVTGQISIDVVRRQEQVRLQRLLKDGFGLRDAAKSH